MLTEACELLWSRFEMIYATHFLEKTKKWGATKHTEGLDCYT